MARETDERTDRDGASGVANLDRRRRAPGIAYSTWLDDVIRDAEAAGMFDNLAGQGKPLLLEDPAEALDEWWLAHRMLKQAGYAPRWIELRKEVADLRPAVVAARDAYREAAARLDPRDPETEHTLARLKDRFVALASEVNEKVEEHNLLRPWQIDELARFPLDVARRGPGGRSEGGAVTSERVNTVTDHGCFGCGERNPIGLRLAFYRDDGGGVRADFTPAREHEGYHGMTHGGILSTVLDEAMSWAVLADGRLAVTTRMEVRFRRPVPVEQPVEVVAEVVRDRGRLVETRGEIRDAAGTVLVSATGSFIRVSDAQQQAWEAVYFDRSGE